MACKSPKQIGGGEFTTSENENLDNVTAKAPTNDGYWTDAGNYATSFAGGNGYSNTPYLIETPQQLARMAYLMNSQVNTASYSSKCYQLTANIDMSEYYWDSPGVCLDINMNTCIFSGEFDGNGYSISGLFIEPPRVGSMISASGFFSNCYGEVHDLSLINCDILGVTKTGGIVGSLGADAIIYNCYVSGKITTESSDYGAGGIAYEAYGIIYNCYNEATVGGLNVDYAGGICAELERNGSIYNCYNLGKIGAKNCTYAGGICAYVMNTPSTTYTIHDCYNKGEVESGNYAGGIIGYTGQFVGGIHNCYNLGNIYTALVGGGIAGRLANAPIYNCYNLGNVVNTGSSAYAEQGAITGYSNDDIYNCYYGGNCSLAKIAGNLDQSWVHVVDCGTCSIDEAKSESWYLDTANWLDNRLGNYWDFEETWSIVEGMNDGYPILMPTLEIMQFTITYHPNGASGDEVVESKVGSESYTIRSNMFTRSGYNFTGWNTQANGGGQSYSAGASYLDLANLDLYAQWSRITYTIKYNKNASDATGSMANTTKYYGTNVTLRSNAFKRTGYTFLGWATEKDGDVVYSNGATYSANANVTLYAKWDPHKYTIVFNGNGSTSGSMKEQTFEYGKEQKLTSNAFKKTGFTFSKWTRNADGTGASYTNGQSVSNLTSSNGATINLYAQWTARNEAKYDSAGKYWYIENGKIPQTKVTNSTLISNLNKATTNGANYYIAGQTLTAKVYSGKEYCKWNNNWYEVEPIKWRLDASSSQKDGYGTTTDTNAVLAEIVYVDQYSSSSIDAGEGYSNQSVTDFMRNGISTTYLVNYATSTQTFGTGASLYGTNASTKARMFVSSQSEINAVNGTMNMTFSDLVKDMIKYYGGTNSYFTRDLGSNYNNITCINAVGKEIQRFATDYRGLQFTVRFTEYGCVS